MIIYLGGCAWGCGYYIGIFKAIREIYPNEEIKIHGCSAGALAGVYMILNISINNMKKHYLHFSTIARENGVIFKMVGYHKKLFSELIDNDKQIYKKINNKLTVGITQFPLIYVKKTVWNSNEELKNDLHTSMCIPIYSSFLNKTNGYLSIDGGLSCDIHKLDSNIIKIGVIQKGYDICGNLSFNDMWFPPTEKQLNNLINKGYNDFINYTKNKNKNKNKVIKENKIKQFFIVLILWILHILSIPCILIHRYINDSKKFNTFNLIV